MDALFLPFLAALLAEIGDRTQRLAALLAVRFESRGRVLGGIAAAALANSLIAAAAGRLMRGMFGSRGMVNFAGISLMVAIALIFAGAGALLRQKPPEIGNEARGGPFLASFLAAFVLGFGDKTQFLTLTLAARADSLWLAGLGAAAGTIIAALPAILLGARLPRALPLAAGRVIVGILFLVTGFAAGVDALRLA